MADWNDIVASYEAKIAALEAEAVTYAKSSTQAVLITSGIALVIGILIGLAL